MHLQRTVAHQTTKPTPSMQTSYLSDPERQLYPDCDPHQDSHFSYYTDTVEHLIAEPADPAEREAWAAGHLRLNPPPTPPKQEKP